MVLFCFSYHFWLSKTSLKTKWVNFLSYQCRNKYFIIHLGQVVKFCLKQQIVYKNGKLNIVCMKYEKQRIRFDQNNAYPHSLPTINQCRNLGEKKIQRNTWLKKVNFVLWAGKTDIFLLHTDIVYTLSANHLSFYIQT